MPRISHFATCSYQRHQQSIGLISKPDRIASLTASSSSYRSSLDSRQDTAGFEATMVLERPDTVDNNSNDQV